VKGLPRECLHLKVFSLLPGLCFPPPSPSLPTGAWLAVVLTVLTGIYRTGL